MRRRIIGIVALIPLILGVAGCAEFVSEIVGDTPGERESKIQRELERMQIAKPFKVGETDGAEDAFDIPATNRGSIHKEAIARMRARNPAFDRGYTNGFIEGWIRASYPSRDGPHLSLAPTALIGERDFRYGRGNHPEKYGFTGRRAREYRIGWNRVSRLTGGRVSGRVGFDPNYKIGGGDGGG